MERRITVLSLGTSVPRTWLNHLDPPRCIRLEGEVDMCATRAGRSPFTCSGHVLYEAYFASDTPALRNFSANNRVSDSDANGNPSASAVLTPCCSIIARKRSDEVI